jgi:hypothetical protein
MPLTIGGLLYTGSSTPFIPPIVTNPADGAVILSIVQNADKSWTFTWQPLANTTTYRVVLWGIQLALTTSTSYTWTGFEYKDFPPPLEIMSEDAGTLALTEIFQPYLVMQWYGETCSYYQVEQYLSASSLWNPIRQVTESGVWMYTYQTPTLLDETLYQFQVVAVDFYGNRSTPRLYTRYVVTTPFPPDSEVTLSYAAGNVVISATV